jgi:hypothetical protein
MIIISLATVIYGVSPLIADLSITHVFHPDCPPCRISHDLVIGYKFFHCNDQLMFDMG